MVSMVAQIGIRVLWETYCYDFSGKTFLQKEGGPIGQRPTMEACPVTKILNLQVIETKSADSVDKRFEVWKDE